MPDYIITNCQLFRPFHPSNNKLFQIRIKGDRIVAVEENGYRLGKSKVFNAKGRTVAASFKDSHIHLLRYSLMKRERDLRRIHSWEHLKEQLTDDHERQVLDHNDWLVGRGLADDSFKDRDTLLMAKDLDMLDIDNPIFLLHQDGHECVLNSKALDMIKKDQMLKKIDKRFIEIDEDGNWLGRFKDTAVHFIKMHFRNKTTAQAKKALRESFPHLAEYGITHVDSDDLNYVGDYAKVWKAYTELDQEVGLPFGAYLHHYVYDIDDMKYYLKHFNRRTGDGEGNVRVGAFKIFVDGTYRLHTAALNFPYADENSFGTLIYEQPILNEMLKLAEENNMQVAMHCIGDRAVETAANAIMNANQHERNPLRHRIIHMQNTRSDLLRYLGHYRIPVETQPGFVQKEWPEYEKWLGKNRTNLVQVGQSLVDNNIKFTGSSDAPIGSLNPAEHVYAAVNRMDNNGNPVGGWHPEQRISIDEAYNSYCATPAYLNHSDDTTGRLLPGFHADLMLLEEHPHEADPTALNKIRVDALWYRGQMVFDRYD